MMTVNEAQNVHFLRFAAMSIVQYQLLEVGVPHLSMIFPFLIILDYYSIVRSLELAALQGKGEGAGKSLKSKAVIKTLWLTMMSWVLVFVPSLVNTETKSFSLTFVAFLVPLGFYAFALKKIEKMIIETAAKIEEGGE